MPFRDTSLNQYLNMIILCIFLWHYNFLVFISKQIEKKIRATFPLHIQIYMPPLLNKTFCQDS